MAKHPQMFEALAIYPPALEAALHRFLGQGAQPPSQAEAAAFTIEAALPGSGESAQAEPPTSIGVVPVQGFLAQKGPRDVFEAIFRGGSSMERIGEAVRQLAADGAVSAIVLDIDSPGGTVAGTPELADVIFAARQAKPVVAVANSLAASAAYWIGSQASEIVVAPSSQVGSIGVFAIHEDITKMADQMGVKITAISAGKHKLLGAPFEPLTDETTAIIQKGVDEQYAQFVNHVARGRGVKGGEVRSGFGEGWIAGAKEAVSLGMADRIGTLRETIARLGTARGRATVGARAEHADGDLELRTRRMRLAELG